MIGRRLPDRPIGGGPHADDQPGDYWLVQLHDGSRLLNVIEHPEDRRYWSNSSTPAAELGNLTGWVVGLIDPSGRFGMLSIHTVRVEDDETISVRPGDGSSNSILIDGGPETTPVWHGYIEHGVWSSC